MSNKYFVHEKAICESDFIGSETKIWAFAHILPGAKIGSNCNICDGVFVENDVSIGDDVTIKCGVQVWDGVSLEDGVFIGPNVTFTNDIFPRSKSYPEQFLKTIVCKGASIGANSTILPGVTIGHSAMIGAGSVVTKDVPSHAVVVGNPAHIVSYNSEHDIKCEQAVNIYDVNSTERITVLDVRGCQLCSLPVFDDMRGSLMASEFTKDLPFIPKRSFFVHNVPSNKIRGEHAHKVCEQFLVAVAGQLSVVIDDGRNRQEVKLSSPSQGLYMPSGTWGVQYKFSENAVLCVYASHEYDSSDYIREYSQFIRYSGESDVTSE
ncbi:WxcM-like domain-containing protein [Vibrio echinoideorum]|uniref:WxcM-like domain-containing protein n=1 Tax=Vibrio echinoideorum TaxID=2100116 RepID=UPI003550CAE7